MNLINWLLEGDVSIQYQTKRDLLNENDLNLKKQISKSGFGKIYLDHQNADHHWGLRYYQPKWTSTHYTLLELRNLNMNSNVQIQNALNDILEKHIADDGGITPLTKKSPSDVCLNGMVLNFMCYFGAEEDKLKSTIDFILLQQLPDGGFNCRYNSRGSAVHSSLHSTLSVLEGIEIYYKNGYKYRLKELLEKKKGAIEFILMHRLYLSDRTGKIISKRFTMLSYPSRWKYDILKALDYFQYAAVPYDVRMKDALDLLISKRRRDGTWPVQAKHPGAVFFDMEKAGTSSRWNTLRALRVLKYFNINI